MQAKDLTVYTFRHSTPYVGCFWEQQLVVYGNDSEDMHGVAWQGSHKLPYTPKELREDGYIENVQALPWNDVLHLEIPENFIPAFWNFADGHDIEFTWECAKCGETVQRPVEMSGYRGNNGTGITALGWYCEDCYCSISCSYCGSMNDSDNPWWDYDEDMAKEYNRGICPACHNEM